MPSPRRKRAIVREKRRRLASKVAVVEAVTVETAAIEEPVVAAPVVEEPVVAAPRAKTTTNRVGRRRKTQTTD